MVRIARRQVPRAKFICGSISRAALPSAAAAVAINEVFNYLGSHVQMARAFSNIYRSLKPGGSLIFDIKHPLPGARKTQRSVSRWGKDWAMMAEVMEDPQRNRLVRKILSFRKSGNGFRRTEEIHRQTILQPREFVRLLRDAGFQVRVYGSYGNAPLPRDRKVIVAKKPLR
jgi:trans-aconitate methyltransferase